METKASYVVIGAFTLGILTLAFLFVLWIGKLQLDREWDYYDIVFQEAVAGLSVGGAVQYNGIQIGEVRRLSLDQVDQSQVVARVRLNGGTPVRADTHAELTFTGLTGVAVIQLGGGTAASPLLASHDPAAVPRIVAKGSSLQKLLVHSEGLVMGVNDLLPRMSLLLSKENLANVAASIAHLEKITGTTAAHADEIGRAIADITEASRALRATLSHSEAMVQKLEQLADSGTRVLDGETREMLVSARLSLDSARRFTDSAHAVVAENRAAVANFTNRELAQVGPALVDLRAALRDLQRLAEQIEDDPSALLRGKEKTKEYVTR